MLKKDGPEVLNHRGLIWADVLVSRLVIFACHRRNSLTMASFVSYCDELSLILQLNRFKGYSRTTNLSLAVIVAQR